MKINFRRKKDILIELEETKQKLIEEIKKRDFIIESRISNNEIGNRKIHELDIRVAESRGIAKGRKEQSKAIFTAIDQITENVDIACVICKCFENSDRGCDRGIKMRCKSEGYAFVDIIEPKEGKL